MSVTNSPIDLGLDWSYTKTQEHIRNKSLGNYLILRGKDSFLADPGPFEDIKLYSNTTRSSPLLQTRYHVHNYNSYDKHCTLVSNDQLHLAALEVASKSVWKLFHSRAYIHHFTEKGMEEKDIFETFIQAEQVINDYKSLSLPN
ncbi:Tubulin delta chain-like [Oopsacas minuta]|uniref:Tubulin delta chain-like n=1 Tax=Oopsacas minuta TaxID=111878 RepID=A0AAV7JI39_9METZ|nr:Tubulin delta chain-like [Oopsacas minuta]